MLRHDLLSASQLHNNGSHCRLAKLNEHEFKLNSGNVMIKQHFFFLLLLNLIINSPHELINKEDRFYIELIPKKKLKFTFMGDEETDTFMARRYFSFNNVRMKK